MAEIDFFRGLFAGEGEERRASINLRYVELLQEEGDTILPAVTEARSKGDNVLIERLQKQAKLKVAMQVAFEYGLVSFEREPEPLIDGTFIPPMGHYED
jgi:hypothetical protein